MPLEVRGPFNTIRVSLPSEQPPLSVPVAGGGRLTISLFELQPSRFSRFSAIGAAEVIARAGVIRAARIAAQGVATVEGRAGVIRRALVHVLGGSEVAPVSGVRRGARIEAQGGADVAPVAGVKRGARVQIAGGSTMVVVLIQFAPFVDESGCIVVPQVPAGRVTANVNESGCIVAEGIA